MILIFTLRRNVAGIRAMLWCLWVTFLTVLFLVFLYRDSVKPKGFPPGPAWSPVLGCLFQVKSMLNKLGFHYSVMEALSRAYGSVVGLRLGRDKIILVSQQEYVRKVLSSEEFDGRPDGFFFRMRSYGKRLGVVFADGDHFREQKKFCLAALKKLGMGKRRMEEVIQKEAEELVSSMSRKCKTEASLQMNEIFDVPVLNSLWCLVTGQRFDLEDEKLGDLIGLVHEAFGLLDMSGGVLNQMPLLRFVAPNRTGYNRIRFVLRKFETFLQEAVAQHRNSSPGAPENFIDMFLEEMRSPAEKTSFTDEQLIVLLLDLFMAGSETTSNNLATAILYMIIHPKIQQKVHSAIDHVVRDRRPEFGDRAELGYVDAVLLEVLRHATVVPISVAHRSMREVILGGFTIPENTTVLINLRSVLMDESHWKDPENFRPDRFLDENGRVIQDEWFYPFGQGKRRCLGEGLARATTFLLFASVMQNFQFFCEGEPPSTTPRDGITLSPKPFRARVVRRKPDETW